MKPLLYIVIFFGINTIMYAQSPVTWTDLDGVAESGNDLQRTASGTGWDAGAASANVLDAGEDGWVSTEAVQTNVARMIGLSEVNVDAHYNTIDYAIYLRHNGVLRVYENGNYINEFGTYTGSDVISVERIGSTIYYKKNNSILYESTVPSATSLIVDVSIDHGTLYNVQISNSFSGTGGGTSEDPSLSLVAHYNLNGSFADISENGFNGTEVGMLNITEDRNGDPSGAYEFDGESYVNLNTTIDNSLVSGATFTAWINAQNLASGSKIFLSNYNGNGQQGNCQGRIGFVFRVNDDGTLGVQYLVDGDDYYGRKTSPGTISDNTWYHVAATWDGVNHNSSGFKLYVDGVRSDNLDYRGGSSCNQYIESDEPFKIGMHECASGLCAGFEGIIDEVSIYSRELSESEINDLINPPADNEPPVEEPPTEGGGSRWAESGDNIYFDGGDVGIGTEDTFGYKLAVSGVIGAKEVNVELTSAWPDYVFSDDYKLMTLEQLNAFINQNNHLPNVPSAGEVKESGISVGEMNAKLLEKIEELTLYLLQLKEENIQQQNQIEQLINQNKH